MNQQLNHLTDRQIEQYVDGASADGPGQDNDEIEAHFSDCDYCRRRYLEAERVRLGMVERHFAETPYPDCPGQEALQGYAAGLCSPEKAAEIRTHAARCDFCAPRLKRYLEDFSEELPEETKDLLGRLPASTKEWRRKFVREHIVGHRGFFKRLKRFFTSSRPHGLFWRVSFAGGLALVILGVPVVSNVVAKIQLDKAEELTVAAFKENPSTKDLRYTLTPRAFDIRLGRESGTEPSSSRIWIQAEDLANEKLASGNPKWLRIKGRLDLLNKNIDAADFLQRAYDKGLRDPGTELDLAAAYFLQDTKEVGEHGKPDVQRTVNWLLKVLDEPQLSPEERTTAQYDLAIAYETMPQWDLAVSAWEHYLELDPSGPWAEEAKRHLEADRNEVHPAPPEGYDTPAFFEEHASDSEVKSAIEEYQDYALRTWLLERTGERAAEAMQATRTLAGILEKEHQDPWMKDFLQHTGASDLSGVQALGAAITNNKRNLLAEALRDAENAQMIFKRTGNIPGLLRAQFEQMYANQRSLKGGPACLEQARSLDAMLPTTRTYRWLQIQLALTRAACLYRQREFEAAGEQLSMGHQNATQFGFHVLELRALALDAGMNEWKGCDQSWQTAVAGLEVYWRGPSLPRRKYEFYTDIKQCLERRKMLYAAEALQRRMIFILENEMHRTDQDMGFEETAKHALIEILIENHESAPVSDWHVWPTDPAFATYQLPIRLRSADYLLVSGKGEAALTQLEKAKDLVRSTNDELIRKNFYRIYGDVLLNLRRVEDAATAYKTGLEIAERAFGNLKTEENRVAWSKETGELYRGLVDTFLARGEIERGLQLWEWYQSRPWASEANQTATGPISWPQVEAEVFRIPVSAPAGGTRLIYAFIKDRVRIWTVTGAGVRLAAPVETTPGDMQQYIAQYAEDISTKNPNMVNLEEDSERLFSLLLKPVMPDLHEAGTVIVELDPVMKDLTVEALKSPGGWYFGLLYPVVYSAGVVKEAQLRSVTRRAPTSPWFLNALTADDRSPLGTLNGVKFQNALTLTTTEIPNRLRDTEIFVFVGHGVPGGLQMPNRRPLGAEDFPAGSLQNLQLAALVACSSGSSQHGLLDTGNLAHALLSGGVPSVIASQWDVSREKTDQLFGSFYKHFQQGETPARSMLAARQEVFNAGSQHPYYWAAFTLTGRAD